MIMPLGCSAMRNTIDTENRGGVGLRKTANSVSVFNDYYHPGTAGIENGGCTKIKERKNQRKENSQIDIQNREIRKKVLNFASVMMKYYY